MKSLLIILAILHIGNIQAQPASQYLTTISKSIIIDKDITTVFEVVKNTMNDYIWRSEVNHMSADAPFKEGTTYTEDAHIGFNRNFITKTILLKLLRNQSAFYETPKEARYYLSSLRQVKEIRDNKTLFSYTVEFDSRMSKETLGLLLSPKILKKYYALIMGKYLRNLKSYLE